MPLRPVLLALNLNKQNNTFKSSSCRAATAFASFSFGETKLLSARVISGAVIAENKK